MRIQPESSLSLRPRRWWSQTGYIWRRCVSGKAIASCALENSSGYPSRKKTLFSHDLFLPSTLVVVMFMSLICCHMNSSCHFLIYQQEMRGKDCIWKAFMVPHQRLLFSKSVVTFLEGKAKAELPLTRACLLTPQPFADLLCQLIWILKSFGSTEVLYFEKLWLCYHNLNDVISIKPSIRIHLACIICQRVRVSLLPKSTSSKVQGFSRVCQPHDKASAPPLCRNQMKLTFSVAVRFQQALYSPHLCSNIPESPQIFPKCWLWWGTLISQAFLSLNFDDVCSRLVIVSGSGSERGRKGAYSDHLFKA